MQSSANPKSYGPFSRRQRTGAPYPEQKVSAALSRYPKVPIRGSDAPSHATIQFVEAALVT